MKQTLLFILTTGSIGAMLLVLGWLVLRSDYRTAHGPVVPARVTGKYSQSGGRSGPDYFLLLQFSPRRGQPAEARLSVSKERYAAARPGETVSISYDPTEPLSVRRAGAPWFNPWYLIPLGGGVVGVGLALLGLLSLARNRTPRAA
ncbi:DUF3592 domain-containing protein [Hymenobacter sp. BT175]|uniref:DUF3592 domain-containing protein n=1 Tax=Hymenobacter translucens TaxID=2886507 RepID=UPI001D0EC722|nr:DUF3592 domain-containing protein [Hymenobacter translucens]MCC2547577.1 DUF3592 domain-containing protein [Hymenobacter translucens]